MMLGFGGSSQNFSLNQTSTTKHRKNAIPKIRHRHYHIHLSVSFSRWNRA